MKRLNNVSELADGIARDINSPMQFLMSNVEFLRESVPRIFGVVDNLCAMLGAVDLETDRARRLVLMEGALKDIRYEHLRVQTSEALSDCAEGVRRVTEIVRKMKAVSLSNKEAQQAADGTAAVPTGVAESSICGNDCVHSSTISSPAIVDKAR